MYWLFGVCEDKHHSDILQKNRPGTLPGACYAFRKSCFLRKTPIHFAQFPTNEHPWHYGSSCQNRVHKTMDSENQHRTLREKQRREAANARMREKVREARTRGICRCGGQLDIKPGTTRYYSTCPVCRVNAKPTSTRYYREGPLPPRERPPVKLDSRLHDSTGVRRRLERDGLGREAWWWFASGTINRRQYIRRWSVDKYGDRGAWKLAIAQRWEWEKLM